MIRWLRPDRAEGAIRQVDAGAKVSKRRLSPTSRKICINSEAPNDHALLKRLENDSVEYAA